MKLPAVLGVLLILGGTGASALDPFWSASQLRKIESLSIANLRPPVPDPSNRLADDPSAAALGKALFFDASFSANGSVSCASCHMPAQQFQDGLPVGKGIAEGSRRTMPIAGTAYHPFLFWDGRKDSQWSQALAPLENPLEHGADRAMIVRLAATKYRAEYELVFGPLPDFAGFPVHAAPAGTPEAVAAWQALTADQQRQINRVFSNLGKAIAAFERTIGPPATRFDEYAEALLAKDEIRANEIFSEPERNGLKLFITRGNCSTCHNGPQFTDMQFHNVGLPGNSLTDSGRSTSVFELQRDPFNCLGEFSDAAGECGELQYMKVEGDNLVGAFKSPSLRGVSQRPPFTHAGQFATMRDLMVHYNKAPKAAFGASELKPLNLTDQQLVEIEAFLQTLNVTDSVGPLSAP